MFLCFVFRCGRQRDSSLALVEVFRHLTTHVSLSKVGPISEDAITYPSYHDFTNMRHRFIELDCAKNSKSITHNDCFGLQVSSCGHWTTVFRCDGDRFFCMAICMSRSNFNATRPGRPFAIRIRDFLNAPKIGEFEYANHQSIINSETGIFSSAEIMGIHEVSLQTKIRITSALPSGSTHCTGTWVM